MMKCRLYILGALALLASCQRATDTVWEDTKTLGRSLKRTGKMLLKHNPDSRLIDRSDQLTGPEEDFIPLSDHDLLVETLDLAMPQPKAEPGVLNGPVPSIEFFKTPSGELASIFQLVHFDTDKHVFTNPAYERIVEKMAAYLKQHPQDYLFIEGHCDERASEAYNLALGTRRANYVRGLMIKYGVDPNRVYSVSFGKERPLEKGHSTDAWAKNRRAEFKIYSR